ncbi:MAG: LuxR C-terminal-related transcriptional regulator [Longimicrobiaceae bacterium]
MASSDQASNHVIAVIPVLETKLYVPGRRAGLVSRPRLVERLQEVSERKLTVVSAPAGFGKTTLLTEWLADSAAGERTAGWVSLDATENEPALFWAYFIRALQKVHPTVGEHALSLLRSPQPPLEDPFLRALIHEIDALDAETLVVLDDYHVIQAPAIHEALSFLLDRLPSRMHLVLASRSAPPLPLSRLRARGELMELGHADLRFTADEVSAFLNEEMALDIGAADLTRLEQRTEGWIAGLKLAALSMKGRDDVREFVHAFSGDHRYITDYLGEEVLQRQPEAVRDFLLRTSVLERLSGPLCDAVTGGEDGRSMLQELERRNLFVVPLDDRREWYRYHHLFAEVLQAHLAEDQPERVRTLHRRASAWHQQQGSPGDAVRHALAAGEMKQVAELLELTWPAMNRAHQTATWLGWARALPDAQVRDSPVLSVGYAWALLNEGELEEAEARLRDAERTVEAAERGGPVSEQLRALPASVATARAYLAQARGDVPGTIEHARRSLGLLAEEDHLARAPAAALLGLAHWTAGDLEEAHRTFGAGMDSLRAGGDPLSAIGGSFILGDIRAAQGRLREAARTHENLLKLAAELSPQDFPGVGGLYLGLADLRRERGDLASAARLLKRAREAYDRGGDLGAGHRWRVAAARLRVSEGDLERALGLLEEAERMHVRSPLPDVRPAAALRARLWVALGRLDEAGAWVRERGLSADDEPGYLREFEHLTLARLLLALPAGEGGEDSGRDALGLLGRLADAAEAGERTGSLVEILILRALAQQARGSTARALGPLERALLLAEPERFFRIFVDEGEPMRFLLRRAAAAGIAGGYTRDLLAAFDVPRPAETGPHPHATGLARPLTDRELEILRLIAAGMRNQEIADQLSIRLTTVKRHIANTYGKLDVGHRTAAVARATELELL